MTALLVAGLVLAAPAGPAWALDEVQLTEPTCTALHLTQNGLPPSTAFEVTLRDVRDSRVLGQADTRSSATGRLDVQLAAGLRGVAQVVAEVEADSGPLAGREYGEAGLALPQPCPASPAPAPAASPAYPGASAPAGSAAGGSGPPPLAGAPGAQRETAAPGPVLGGPTAEIPGAADSRSSRSRSGPAVLALVAAGLGGALVTGIWWPRRRGRTAAEPPD